MATQREAVDSSANESIKEKEVKSRRDELFRSGWRNQRPPMPLVSREEDNAFQFLVHWCEEFSEVRHKHRERLSDPNPRIRNRSGASQKCAFDDPNSALFKENKENKDKSKAKSGK